MCVITSLGICDSVLIVLPLIKVIVIIYTVNMRFVKMLSMLTLIELTRLDRCKKNHTDTETTKISYHFQITLLMK